MSFAFKRPIVIDHTKCGVGNSASFPVLISGTFPFLATLANGGNVTSANGYDIAFYADSGLTVRLPWETEIYTAATGLVVYWVQVPTLTTSQDTILFMAYGDATISSDQSTPTAVWDSHYLGVYHFGTGVSLSLADSTSNANTLTNHGATAASGLILGGASFNGSTNFLDTTANFTALGGTQVSMEVVAQSSTWAASYSLIEKPSVNTSWQILNEAGVVELRGGGTSPQVVTAGEPSNTVFHEITCTMNGTAGNIYVDGQPSGSGSVVTLVDNAGKLNIGSFDSGAAYFFNGIMDEARVSNTTRNADWMLASWNNMNSPGTFFSVGAPHSLNRGGGLGMSEVGGTH